MLCTQYFERCHCFLIEVGLSFDDATERSIVVLILRTDVTADRPGVKLGTFLHVMRRSLRRRIKYHDSSDIKNIHIAIRRIIAVILINFNILLR